MLLVGRDLSPFVRRCGVTLRLYGLPFEQVEYSTATQLEEIRRYNRLGRVPVLVLDSGENLIDSNAILHHATPRLFYACELGSASRDALLGMHSEPPSLSSAASIGAAWRRRWLLQRSRRPETLAAIAKLGPQSVQAALMSPASDPSLLPI